MRARSMLFTLFGDYVRHFGGTVWVGSLIALMAELGFTAPAVRAAVSRMARQGWLLPIRAGRASYYALSPRGQARIDEAAQRIFKLHPERWDRLWRLLVVLPWRDAPMRGQAATRPGAYGVSQDVPDRRGQAGSRAEAARDPTRRAALRRELGWMGFAPISRGVYVSPNDLLDRCASMAERYGLAGQIETFTAQHHGASPDPGLASRYWDLDAIDAAYTRFVGQWKPRLEERRTREATGIPLADETAFAEKTRLVHAFRKFLFVDPGLPQDLLPERWSGLEAGVVFSGYYHLLTEGALRFFEHYYRPAPGHEADVPEGRRAARRDPFRASAAAPVPGPVPTA